MVYISMGSLSLASTISVINSPRYARLLSRWRETGACGRVPPGRDGNRINHIYTSGARAAKYDVSNSRPRCRRVSRARARTSQRIVAPLTAST